MRRLAVSAPGKLILIGEHAVVYGRPAVVAAFGRRLTVAVEELAEEGRVELDLGPLGAPVVTDWEAIRRRSDQARRAWERHFGPGPEQGAAAPGPFGPAGLTAIALGEAERLLAPGPRPGLRLRVSSDLPVGAGFGSSAALATAVVAATLRWGGHPAGGEVIETAALEAERRQHGTPSGVDTAAVRAGGVLWWEPAAGAPATSRPLDVASPPLPGLAVFHSGPPAESTGQVVAAVRRLGRDEPARHGAALDAIEAATRALAGELEKAAADPATVIAALRSAGDALEALGVVPDAVRRAVRRVEAEGGAAKVSGAGALAGPGAGSVLVYHPDPEAIAGWDFLAGWERLEAPLGVAGVREEPA